MRCSTATVLAKSALPAPQAKLGAVDLEAPRLPLGERVALGLHVPPASPRSTPCLKRRQSWSNDSPSRRMTCMLVLPCALRGCACGSPTGHTGTLDDSTPDRDRTSPGGHH